MSRRRLEIAIEPGHESLEMCHPGVCGASLALRLRQGGTGPLEIPDGFESDQPTCLVNYELREEGQQGYDETIFTFDPASALITIETSDIAIHLQETVLILRATSVESGEEA